MHRNINLPTENDNGELLQLQEQVLDNVWDNTDDAVYDEVVES